MTDLITEIKKDRAEGTPDYDAGLLNDFGGGNVDWWMDYIRAEIGRANEYWRDIHEADAARIAELNAKLAEVEARVKELKLVINEASDPDFIFGAMDNVHDMDTGLMDYAKAASRAIRAMKGGNA